MFNCRCVAPYCLSGRPIAVSRPKLYQHSALAQKPGLNAPHNTPDERKRTKTPKQQTQKLQNKGREQEKGKNSQQGQRQIAADTGLQLDLDIQIQLQPQLQPVLILLLAILAFVPFPRFQRLIRVSLALGDLAALSAGVGDWAIHGGGVWADVVEGLHRFVGFGILVLFFDGGHGLFGGLLGGLLLAPAGAPRLGPGAWGGGLGGVAVGG